MSKRPLILVVEHDILVRQPLAEYLRECGYLVIEAMHTDEAVEVLSTESHPVDVLIADVSSRGRIDGFGLARWVRARGMAAKVILSGTMQKSLATAEELCERGPLLSKPYDHTLLHDRIKRELAARDREAK